MTRWITQRTTKNIDNESMQVVSVYSEEHNKEFHKRELRDYSYKRLLLIREKHRDNLSYYCKSIGE